MQRVPLAPGDRLVFVTDGMLERNAEHLDVAATLAQTGDLHPRELVHALGAAVYEEFSYSPDGAFLSGTFADYLLPTTMEVPSPVILHMETPSPFTPLGAKGVGEGNCMSTPVCIANAVADALGIAAIDLPLTPAKLAKFIHPKERTS